MRFAWYISQGPLPNAQLRAEFIDNSQCLDAWGNIQRTPATDRPRRTRRLGREDRGQMTYDKGLHEVGDGVWAYLQPDGGWGWSNAGLVTDGEASLLVDTLFDLRLTAEMLDAMRQVTRSAERIGTVVNTHANGDHCYGNALLAGSEIISSARCAEEMVQLPPSTMAAMMRDAPSLGPAGAVPGAHLRAVLLRGHPAHAAHADLRRPTRSPRRRPHGPADRGGSRPHRRRRHRPPARRGHRLHRATSSSTVATRSCGPGRWPTGSRPATASWSSQPTVVVPGHGPLATPAAVADLKGYFEFLTRGRPDPLRRRDDSDGGGA